MTGVVVGVLVLLAALTGASPSPREHRLRRLLVATSTRPASVGVASPPGRRARRRAARHGAVRCDPALLLSLVGAALRAGASPLTALEAAGRALEGGTGTAPAEALVADVHRLALLLRLGASWDEAWTDVGHAAAPLRGPLSLAVRAGAPGAELLRDAAAELRRRRHREAQRRAQALGVRLVLPLGLCSLPSFVALAVVPVVLGLADQVLA